MKKAFECVNVVKKYLDFGLGPFNLDLDPGMVLGLIGPNGAGKTTLIQCLVGLLRTDSGEMNIFGRPNDLVRPEWKLEIGYVGDYVIFETAGDIQKYTVPAAVGGHVLPSVLEFPHQPARTAWPGLSLVDAHQELQGRCYRIIGCCGKS
jgi:ABC-type siderophore export system fused ATPase/permease subunit